MLNCDFKIQLTNIRQFCTIPLPFWVYSKLTRKQNKDYHESRTNYRTKDTDNNYEITTNNYQRNINICDNITQKQKIEK